jgi:thymidine kinase
MAKLYFKYGAMGSSKTAQALITKYNYEENDMRVWLIKPSADTRDGAATLRSRIGLEAQVEVITPGIDVYRLFADSKEGKCDVVIVDECQFLVPEQIDQLRAIVNDFSVPVLCFGLRTDFQTNAAAQDGRAVPGVGTGLDEPYLHIIFFVIVFGNQRLGSLAGAHGTVLEIKFCHYLLSSL